MKERCNNGAKGGALVHLSVHDVQLPILQPFFSPNDIRRPITQFPSEGYPGRLIYYLKDMPIIKRFAGIAMGSGNQI
jgi:hypothetical protein